VAEEEEEEAEQVLEAVDCIAASTQANQNWDWDEDDGLWFVDDRVGLKTRVGVGSVLLVLSDQNELWQGQVSSLPARDSPRLEVAWFYSAADLDGERFKPQILAEYGITRALSNWFQNVKWGQVIGVEAAAPSESYFFYDRDNEVLSGRPSSGRHQGKAVILRADGSDVKTDDVAELALHWAKAPPHEELGTKFGALVLEELAMANLNSYGPRDAMQETIRALLMVPHKLARDRGLTPPGFEQWEVRNRVGAKSTGTCHACGLQRVLSMELVHLEAGLVYPIGNDCGGRLDRLLSCCHTFHVLRDSAPDLTRIRALLSDLDKLFILSEP
jgi:hypothetical protein